MTDPTEHHEAAFTRDATPAELQDQLEAADAAEAPAVAEALAEKLAEALGEEAAEQEGPRS